MSNYQVIQKWDRKQDEKYTVWKKSRQLWNETENLMSHFDSPELSGGIKMTCCKMAALYYPNPPQVSQT